MLPLGVRSLEVGQKNEEADAPLSSRDLLPPGTSPTQLSPFHHLVIILVRFACENFPHLLPRVLFAEETIGPLVRWRTGGGAASLIREFGAETGAEHGTPEEKAFWDAPEEEDDDDEEEPEEEEEEEDEEEARGRSTKVRGKLRARSNQRKQQRLPAPPTTKPSSQHRSSPTEQPSNPVRGQGFRAFWIGGDSQMPNEIRRASESARQATTILYLHGGGMTLGSVAFYAEALIRILAKVCAIERKGGLSTSRATNAGAARRLGQVEPGEARCIAVEYTLSPGARFPTSLLECLRCYAHLIEVERIDPASIVIAGDSAGANLAMSMLLCMSGQYGQDEAGRQIAEEKDWTKMPMPGKAVLMSPWCDLRPSHAKAFETLRKVPHEAEAETGNATAGKQRRSAGKNGSSGGNAKGKHQSASARRARSEHTPVTAATIGIEDPHRWDYVCPEALLHFAQVYSGVLPTPRRVRGPIGWISHLCKVVAEGYPDLQRTTAGKTSGSTSSAASSSSSPSPSKQGKVKPDTKNSSTKSSSYAATFMDPPKQLAALANPPRRLARAVFRMLDEPMFLKRPSSELANEQQVMRYETRSSDAYLGLDPLFSAKDRETRSVASKSQLFVPFEETMGANPGCTRLGDEALTMAKAATELDHNPLISPAIGDWSKIRLSKGALVVWGERELMSEDIGIWVQKVRRESATPAPDGQADTAQDNWIHAAIEKGPAGVHAWPLVSMYLAGTEAEREKGLDLLARFIARKDTGSHLTGELAESDGFIDTDVVITDSTPVGVGIRTNLNDTRSQSSGSVQGVVEEADLHRLRNNCGGVVGESLNAKVHGEGTG